jgi:hypothetical protein
MLFEYAVEPQAIGSSWQTFRYVIEKFGFDRGRLISEFPKRWLREVYDASLGLPPIERKRIVEALNQARKNKLIRRHRPYDRDAGDWLRNALTEHRREPFRAIIAAENPDSDPAVLFVNELDESNPLMDAPHNCAIRRDARLLADAMKELLRFGSRILFIDPFFDPYNQRYKNTLRACLDIVHTENPSAVCKIHYRYHENKPANGDLERDAAALFCGIIPDGLEVTIFCWQEKAGGVDFHARYLLTEKGGIGVDAGFSAEGGHQTTDMYLMSFDLSQEKVGAFTRGAPDYDLVEPVIRVAADGSVEHV